LGVWGWGFGGWGFGVWGPIPTPQSPIPNPQSPIIIFNVIKILIILKNKYIYKKIKE
jgi:hypothetical protein